MMASLGQPGYYHLEVRTMLVFELENTKTLPSKTVEHGVEVSENTSNDVLPPVRLDGSWLVHRL